MTELQKQLRWILREGNLTIADLARWLDRPHGTVSGWLRGGNLRLPPLDTCRVVRDLDALVLKITQKGTGFPVPEMPFPERREYLDKLKNIN